jgi:putative aminopeptidase FrvX
MKTLIQKLTQTPGPSGFEQEIRTVIREEVSSLSKSVQVDTMGNLIVRIGQKSTGGLRVMIAAHMDEIGVIVSHVDKKGFVRFSNLGSYFPRYLAGSRVRFLNGTRGVINHDRPEDLSKIPGMEKFLIDVGATSDKDCPVKVGDVGVFDREFLDMGNRVASKALDDRISCAVLIETIRNIKSTANELVFVFSTQEEVGSRGAQTAAYAIEADLGIALDVTPTGDILGVKMQTHLGDGPAIKVRDMGMISDPQVINWMVAAAKKLKIKYQLEVLEIGTTDARSMQLVRAGMLAGALSIPCRYVHSPSEVVDMEDVALTVKLLTALLSERIQL